MELPLSWPRAGSGSLLFDPLTQSVTALTPANHIPQNSPLSDSTMTQLTTGVADTQAEETTSQEHLKTELHQQTATLI